MKWTVALPRAVAEDDKVSVEVEADSIEEAIIAAAPTLHHGHSATPQIGMTYLVSARVTPIPRSRLPLRSV